jgi:hypothetical protein
MNLWQVLREQRPTKLANETVSLGKLGPVREKWKADKDQ